MIGSVGLLAQESKEPGAVTQVTQVTPAPTTTPAKTTPEKKTIEPVTTTGATQYNEVQWEKIPLLYTDPYYIVSILYGNSSQYGNNSSQYGNNGSQYNNQQGYQNYGYSQQNNQYGNNQNRSYTSGGNNGFSQRNY
jgi:hypothetical protein